MRNIRAADPNHHRAVQLTRRRPRGKVKTDLDLKLAQIRTRRAAFGTSFAAVETTTAPQWDDMKVRVDKEWADLKAMVDKAE